MNLGVDPRHADQMVRGVINLPNGTGQSVRVAVFARGAKAEEAKAAGADIVGAEDLAEKIIQAAKSNFERCIATPDMMGVVGRLGKVLGPRGLMPNPKLGTVTHGRRRRRQGRQGRLGRVPRREGWHRSCWRRQGLVRRARRWPRTSRRCADRDQSRQAVGRQGHLHQEGVGHFDHGPGPQARRSTLAASCSDHLNRCSSERDRDSAVVYPVPGDRRVARLPDPSCPRLQRRCPDALMSCRACMRQMTTRQTGVLQGNSTRLHFLGARIVARPSAWRRRTGPRASRVRAETRPNGKLRSPRNGNRSGQILGSGLNWR